MWEGGAVVRWLRRCGRVEMGEEKGSASRPASPGLYTLLLRVGMNLCFSKEEMRLQL